MRTVEILIAIVLTTIFMLVIFPHQTITSQTERTSYLTNIENNEEFRNFLTASSGCFNSSQSATVDDLIQRYLPNEYDYALCVGNKIRSLPEKNVYIDTLFFAGNITTVKFKIVRLYYWPND